MNKLSSPFKSQKGEERFLAVYDALMQRWPVPYETLEIPGHFGITHVVASGPQDAPAMVLLHGAHATVTMWSANITDLSRDYRVYAVDLIGQPGKSIAAACFTKREQLVPWFTELLDSLKIEKANLVGQSYGGWFTLNYAILAPQRVNKISLLSPAACFKPLCWEHIWRGAPMRFFPSFSTVRSFKLWETHPDFINTPQKMALFNQKVELLYLGFKYFRIQGESNPDIFTDEQLSSLQAPMLLLIGQQEVIYDPQASLERARRLVPHLEAGLVPDSSHEMVYSQAGIVDERILEFLKERIHEFSY
jgi:pimeloyl-ACP methyl ester carboxylesterase